VGNNIKEKAYLIPLIPAFSLREKGLRQQHWGIGFLCLPSVIQLLEITMLN
jgi:hypothetical protein